MNKYLWLIIIGLVIVGGGIGYKVFLRPAETNPVSTGVVREFTITAVKDRWIFTPEEIEVNRGDTVKLAVVNEDDYDHGIAIEAYGVSQRMPANSTIHIEFVATKAGDAQFYCSVPCGQCEQKSCEVAGVRRSHVDMIGTIHVRDVESGNSKSAVKNSGIESVRAELAGLTADQTIAKLADYLEEGNMNAVLYVFQADYSAPTREALEGLTPEIQHEFASDLRRAKFVEQRQNVRIYSVPGKLENGSTLWAEMSFVKSDEIWFVLSW